MQSTKIRLQPKYQDTRDTQLKSSYWCNNLNHRSRSSAEAQTQHHIKVEKKTVVLVPTRRHTATSHFQVFLKLSEERPDKNLQQRHLQICKTTKTVPDGEKQYSTRSSKPSKDRAHWAKKAIARYAETSRTYGKEEWVKVNSR